jgi:pyruvate dehydrogenase E2 component (dihydrolipoamide acetyltransferase)
MIEFKLPDIGEGTAEGEIVKWLVSAGEVVKEHQSVVEVMTDKATVEVPAPADGTITKLLAGEGDIVPVGDVIFHLDNGGGGAPVAESEPPATSTPEPAPAAAPVLVATATTGKVLAVPSARRVARELGVNLATIAGSGRNGVIRRADVEASVPGQGGVSTAPRPAAASEQRIPFRGVRRKVAEAMTRSVQTAVHFTIVEEVDVTELVRVREKAKALGAQQNIKVTFMPFIMKAVASGLMKFPMLNGHLDEDAGEIVLPGTVNLGIATDTPNGLIVPVISGVESKGLLQLAAELGDLADRTRKGQARPDELRGSTFSITNAGNIGGTLATPIINFPDIAILGVHRIVRRPGVVDTPNGELIEVRQYMNFSCSVDHRLADGADAARFVAHLRQTLEEPGLLTLLLALKIDSMESLV